MRATNSIIAKLGLEDQLTIYARVARRWQFTAVTLHLVMLFEPGDTSHGNAL